MMSTCFMFSFVSTVTRYTMLIKHNIIPNFTIIQFYIKRSVNTFPSNIDQFTFISDMYQVITEKRGIG